MKKLLTSFVLFFVLVTLQGQTNIPLLNGGFTTGTTFTGGSPWTFDGFTVTQSSAGSDSLAVSTSGVINGELNLNGRNSTGTLVANQSELTLSTTPVDISAFLNTSTLMYSFKMSVATATASAAPYNITVKLFDANGVDVTTATQASIVKLQGSYKSGILGAYQQNYCTVVLKPNTTGVSGDAKTISLVVSVGLMLSNKLKFDDFMLTNFSASPVVTASAATNSVLSYPVGLGPSNVESFSVNGSNLTNDIVLTPGANLEISTATATGFANSPITLTQATGTVGLTTIYTRLKAGITLSPGANATTKITVSTTTPGVPAKTIAFTGTINTLAALDNTSSNFSVYANNGSIKVNGVSIGDVIAVFDYSGRKLKSVIADGESAIIPLYSKGLYIVKINSFSQKVLLN
jgi:hypothetical protein